MDLDLNFDLFNSNDAALLFESVQDVGSLLLSIDVNECMVDMIQHVENVCMSKLVLQKLKQNMFNNQMLPFELEWLQHNMVFDSKYLNTFSNGLGIDYEKIVNIDKCVHDIIASKPIYLRKFISGKSNFDKYKTDPWVFYCTTSIVYSNNLKKSQLEPVGEVCSAFFGKKLHTPFEIVYAIVNNLLPIRIFIVQLVSLFDTLVYGQKCALDTFSNICACENVEFVGNETGYYLQTVAFLNELAKKFGWPQVCLERRVIFKLNRYSIIRQMKEMLINCKNTQYLFFCKMILFNCMINKAKSCVFVDSFFKLPFVLSIKKEAHYVRRLHFNYNFFVKKFFKIK